MKVFLFLAEGFEEIEAIAPIDIFRRADIEVTTVSITDHLEVTGAHAIVVKADRIFRNVQFSGDFMLFLPGGMPGTTNLGNHEGLRALIAAQAEANQPLAAICAAPSILGQMGLLKGKEAICYPGFEHLLSDAKVSKQKVVKAGNIHTAKGPGVAVDFALKLVEELRGEAVARRVADGLIL